MKHLLDTGNGADVQFFLLLAHKLILMAAFDAFEAMFRFDAQNAKAVVGGKEIKPVEVPDVEVGAFKTMLSFIYANDLRGLNEDNAMAVLYADILQQLTNLMKQQHSTPTEPSGTCNVPLPDIQPFNNEDESVDFEDGWNASSFQWNAPQQIWRKEQNARVDEITTFGFEETKKRLKKVFARQHSLAIDRPLKTEDEVKILEQPRPRVNAVASRNLRPEFCGPETCGPKFAARNLRPETCGPKFAARPQSSGRKFRAANYGPQVSGRKFRAASFWAAKFEPQASHHQRSHSKQGQAVVLQKGKLPSVNNGIVKKDKAPPNNCYCCGDRHWAQNCPKINWTCRKCSRKGHTEQMCDKIQSFRQNKKNQNQNPKMNMILLPAARINSVHSSNLLRASIRVNSGKIEFILDTSADIT
uniref:BTB domain-containing protein n=1 Tax=Globodera rostochiensis TaxID=31243 RepID=A0A914HTX0_GLORO